MHPSEDASAEMHLESVKALTKGKRLLVDQLLIHPHNQRHRKGDKRKGDCPSSRASSAKRMPTRISFNAKLRP